MTKDEIIKKRYPFYDADIYGKDIELSSEQIKVLMDEYAVQQMRLFAEWLRTNYQNSALEFDNYWEKVQQGEFHLELGEAFTTEQLLEQFNKEKDGKNTNDNNTGS